MTDLDVNINNALREAGFCDLRAAVNSTTWDDGSTSVEVVVHQRNVRETTHGKYVTHDYVWSTTFVAWPTVDDVVAEFIAGLTLTRALRPWLNLTPQETHNDR